MCGKPIYLLYAGTLHRRVAHARCSPLWSRCCAAAALVGVAGISRYLRRRRSGLLFHYSNGGHSDGEHSSVFAEHDLRHLAYKFAKLGWHLPSTFLRSAMRTSDFRSIFSVAYFSEEHLRTSLWRARRRRLALPENASRSITRWASFFVANDGGNARREHGARRLSSPGTAWYRGVKIKRASSTRASGCKGCFPRRPGRAAEGSSRNRRAAAVKSFLR